MYLCIWLNFLDVRLGKIMAELADNTKIALVRLLLFTICIIVGAAVFQALEGSHQREEIVKYRNVRKQIVLKYNITNEDIKLWAQSFQPNSPPGSREDDFLEWSFGNAFMFAMVVVTTIGYGNLVPKTAWGRVFCIVFALFGIPGTCLTLKSIGDKVAQYVAFTIRGIEKRCFKIQRSKNVELKASLVTVLSTLILFLPLLSCIVYMREPQWTFLECFYFTFITLSTIGFGDFQPNFQKDADHLLLIVAFLGLSLISATFCSLNFWLENYGVRVELIRSFRGKKTSGKRNLKTDAESSRDHQRNVNEAAADTENNTENTRLELPRMSNFDEDLSAQNNGLHCDHPASRKHKKRDSSVSLQLGIFRL